MSTASLFSIGVFWRCKWLQMGWWRYGNLHPCPKLVMCDHGSINRPSPFRWFWPMICFRKPRWRVIAIMIGHSDLQVLRRYLAQTTEDIAQAHRMGSPVDNHKFWCFRIKSEHGRDDIQALFPLADVLVFLQGYWKRKPLGELRLQGCIQTWEASAM